MILYVLAERQINEKTLRFVEENGLREQVRFLVDANSGVIDRLGLRNMDPEPMEVGVPHPATYLLDRDGVVQLVDVRTDFHIWVAPDLLAEALSRLD